MVGKFGTDGKLKKKKRLENRASLSVGSDKLLMKAVGARDCRLGGLKLFPWCDFVRCATRTRRS